MTGETTPHEPRPSAEEWLRLERKVLEKIEKTIRYYERQQALNRKAFRFFGVIAIVVAALAPIFVVGSSSGKVLNLSPERAGFIALVLTTTTAVVEGLRRFFRFEHRWRAVYQAGSSLRIRRDRYRDQRIGLAPGSPEWVANFRWLREEVFGVIGRETDEFFQGVVGPSEVSKSTTKPKAAGAPSSV